MNQWIAQFIVSQMTLQLTRLTFNESGAVDRIKVDFIPELLSVTKASFAVVLISHIYLTRLVAALFPMDDTAISYTPLTRSYLPTPPQTPPLLHKSVMDQLSPDERLELLGCPKRLLHVCLLVATKWIYDVHPDLKSWCSRVQAFPVHSGNVQGCLILCAAKACERVFLKAIDYGVHVTQEQWHGCIHQLSMLACSVSTKRPRDEEEQSIVKRPHVLMPAPKIPINNISINNSPG